MAVEAETGAEPSSSHSQSTYHLRYYPLDLVVVVGRAYSMCAQMQVRVVTEEIIMAQNLKVQRWVIVVGQIPSRASRDGPAGVRAHVPREIARAGAGVGQRAAYP